MIVLQHLPVDHAFVDQQLAETAAPDRAALSASRSAAVLYSRSSSESECEYGRITCACTSAGPRPSRQYCAALPHRAIGRKKIGAVHLLAEQPRKTRHQRRDTSARRLALQSEREIA